MPYRRISAVVLAAGLACVPLPTLAAEASVGKTAKLYEEPFRDAAVIDTLAAASIVEVVGRKGGWSRVQHQQTEGWIRTLDLRFGKRAAEGSVVADTFGLATGRAGSGNVVATTGIRGLDEEDLKSADFSAEQIDLAERYRADGSDAEAAASSAGLKASRLDYFGESDDTAQSTRRQD